MINPTGRIQPGKLVVGQGVDHIYRRLGGVYVRGIPQRLERLTEIGLLPLGVVAPLILIPVRLLNQIHQAVVLLAVVAGGAMVSPHPLMAYFH